MTARALLLGDSGPIPFAGHLRCAIAAGPATLSVAGRIAADAGLERAFEVSGMVAHALRSLQPAKADRFGLLRATWELLALIPKDALGPAGGADLSLLLLSEDPDGACLTGVGLSMVWTVEPSGLTPLVEAPHPLLGPAGRPEKVPGVLHLDGRPAQVVAAPAHRPPQAPALAELPLRSGLRP